MCGHENLQWWGRFFCTEGMKKSDNPVRLQAMFGLHEQDRALSGRFSLEASDKQASRSSAKPSQRNTGFGMQRNCPSRKRYRMCIQHGANIASDLDPEGGGRRFDDLECLSELRLCVIAKRLARIAGSFGEGGRSVRPFFRNSIKHRASAPGQVVIGKYTNPCRGKANA